MDSETLIQVVIRWIHIVAAMFAVGGAAYARFAFIPACKDSLSDADREKVAGRARARWARFVHLCIALLLITGGLNFWLLALKAGVKPMPYHALFGLKFLGALLIFFIASAIVGRSPGFAKYRDKPKGPLSTIIVTGVLIVLLSGMMNAARTGSHPPIAGDASTTTPAP